MTDVPVLSLSNIVEINFSMVPQGLQLPNINSAVFFTTDTPQTAIEHKQYLSASEVAVDYGTSSETFKMTTSFFSQDNGILQGSGYLVIVPLINSVSATTATFTTGELTTNFAALKAVTDGKIGVKIGATTIDITNLNFSQISETSFVADIVSILKQKTSLRDVVISASADKIILETKIVGESATIDFVVSGASGGTDLFVAGLLHPAGSVATLGANATGETITEAHTRIEGKVFYYAILTNLRMEDTLCQETATSIQATKKMLFLSFASTTAISGIAKTIKDAGLVRTKCRIYTNGIFDAILMNVASVSKLLGVNYNGVSTAKTINNKRLQGISPDNNLTQSLVTEARTQGLTMYSNIAGIPQVINGGGNGYDDNQINLDSLSLSIQYGVANVLVQTTTRIPQTEEGVTNIESAIRRVCNQFVTNGCIGLGLEWTGETFGNPDVFKSAIAQDGFYIFSSPITSLTSTQRENREAPPIQIAVQFSGAIYIVKITGIVQA